MYLSVLHFKRMISCFMQCAKQPPTYKVYNAKVLLFKKYRIPFCDILKINNIKALSIDFFSRNFLATSPRCVVDFSSPVLLCPICFVSSSQARCDFSECEMGIIRTANICSKHPPPLLQSLCYFSFLMFMRCGMFSISWDLQIEWHTSGAQIEPRNKIEIFHILRDKRTIFPL